MIRAIKWAFLAVLALALLTVALANRAPVTLHLLPDEVTSFLGFDWAIELPLFAVAFLGIVAGLLIGFVWEWLREAKHRSAAATARREAARLGAEVTRLKAKDAPQQDDVLALLDTPRKAG